MPAGLDREEGRRLYTKMPPLRGCICFKRHRPAFQEITHKFVAHPSIFIARLLIVLLLTLSWTGNSIGSAWCSWRLCGELVFFG